jgi:hypothetical protein
MSVDPNYDPEMPPKIKKKFNVSRRWPKSRRLLLELKVLIDELKKNSMKQIYNAVLYLLLNFNINFASFGLNLGLDLELNSGPRHRFYQVYRIPE